MSTSQPTVGDAEQGKPLWKFVTIIERGARGTVTWKCNYCKFQKQTTYTRMRAHLMKIPGTGISGCTSVKSNHLANFRRAEEEYENKNIKNAQKIVPLPPIATGTHQNQLYMPPPSNEPSKKRKVEEFIEKGFNRRGWRELDALIARFFYSSGLPFHVARNPYYSACISYAANNNLSGYTPPGYNLLRDRLLQSEKSNVDRLLKPIKSTWREKGVSIVSDGWSDSQRRPLIFFLAVTNGPMFLKVVDCSGETKDKYFIYTLMKEVIEEVGSENVVQVITDNAKNCAGAGKLIQDEYKNIFWTPCVVHTFNLALQNICAAKNVESNQVTYDECSWISIVSADVNMIKNFIMNHGKRLDMFNTFVPLKLLSIAPTRFASVVVMLRRFKLLKQSLGVMVMSTEWNAYREDDVIKAKFVKDKVIDDIWWDQIDYILAFTGPIYDMLRECDTDRPSLHLVYDMWDSMIEKVRHAIYENEKKQVGESSSFYDVVYDILISRWTKNNTPLHCLAHSLNPRYYSQRWLNEDRARVPPHRDNEVSKERMACLKKYFVEPGVRERATLEFANFSSNGEDFADSDSIDHRSSMDPKSWWVTYGASAPILQSLALKLLVQPSSSSCADRNWSTYSFVHSIRRNKMTPSRAEDLVFIHSNLRLLSRKTPQYNQGESKLWDIGGDTFGTLDDLGELDVAQLSLDEPELESVIFKVTNVTISNDGDDENEKDDSGAREENPTIDLDD